MLDRERIKNSCRCIIEVPSIAVSDPLQHGHGKSEASKSTDALHAGWDRSFVGVSLWAASGQPTSAIVERRVSGRRTSGSSSRTFRCSWHGSSCTNHVVQVDGDRCRGHFDLDGRPVRNGESLFRRWPLRRRLPPHRRHLVLPERPPDRALHGAAGCGLGRAPAVQGSPVMSSNPAALCAEVVQ
jgi:hypothetical protein